MPLNPETGPPPPPPSPMDNAVVSPTTPVLVPASNGFASRLAALPARSKLGLAVGVVGVGVGATLLVLGREKQPASTAVVVGPGSVALKGSF